MALPVTIPNTFASATTSIPLSQLDTNFSTLANAINGINSGAETLVNLKASNVTITGGVISNVTLDNVNVDVETLSNVTINGGNVTVTNMVASTANANTINVTTINAMDGTASISLANSTGVLSLSNTIVATAGTSAAPAITTSGDTNTGIFFPAADTIAFAKGGVEAMRITSGGNVGIATTAPAAKLHAAGNTILSNVDMLNASYDSVSFSVAGEETVPTGLFFSPDGTRMYVTGSTGDDVNQYSLSIPWVVSSATYVTVFSVSGQDSSPQGIFFRADGLKMYILGNTNKTVFQYALTIPWTISTASYESISFSVNSQDTEPRGVFFKPNGFTMYVVGSTGDAVNQYALSTAWNVSTATFTQSFSISGQEIQPQDLSFTGDGSRMFIVGATGDDVTVYNLTTPWDISTAATTGQFSVSGQDTAPNGFYVKPDGTKFYMVGATNDTVYQYTIPSIEINLTGTTNINGGATVAQDLTVNGNITFSGGAYQAGYRNIPPVGTKTGSYTLSVGDVGEYVQIGSGGSITIPDGTFAEGDAISLFNNTNAAVTVNCAITTAYIAGTDSDKATVSLATRGVATVLFANANVCVITGNVS